jgi:hypothetical protein
MIWWASLALSACLLGGARCWAQAGRYIPVPRVPGGGGGPFVPHVPWFSGGGSDIFWVIVAIIAIIVVLMVGWHLGQALGRRVRGETAPTPPSAASPASSLWPAEDLILNPFHVEAKAQQTRRLMEFLAHRDQLWDPLFLQEWATKIFFLVQTSWEERDYSPLRDFLMPGLLAKHEGLLHAMRQNREINRIEGLRVDRLEFVHLYCPRTPEDQEFTALITFEAKVYFVKDRTNAYLRGPRTPRLFQEFWTFRRQSDTWRLLTIARSHESDRLAAHNRVEDITDEQLANAQNSVVL